MNLNSIVMITVLFVFSFAAVITAMPNNTIQVDTSGLSQVANALGQGNGCTIGSNGALSCNTASFGQLPSFWQTILSFGAYVFGLFKTMGEIVWAIGVAQTEMFNFLPSPLGTIFAAGLDVLLSYWILTLITKVYGQEPS